MRDVLGRNEIRFTLATRIPHEARIRHARVAMTVDQEFQDLASGTPCSGLLCVRHISPFRADTSRAAGLLPGDAAIPPIASAIGPAPSTAQQQPGPGNCQIIRLFDDYAAAAGLSPATRKRWRPVFDCLMADTGCRDARDLSPDILIQWKDKLLCDRSPITVRDVYLAAVKATLGWAVDERRLPVNPARGVRVRVPTIPVMRDRGFTDDEARAILCATLLPQDPRISWENRAVRRWVPWLLAYTGARVNEITQLRGMDVLCSNDIWYLRITPDAGRVKTGRYRDVPLHPVVLRQGFLDAVASRGQGPIFYASERSKGSDQNPIYKRMGQKLAEWVRTIVPDPAVDPNHGWRHRFKTIGRAAGIPDTQLDAIQGHAPRSVGASYGQFPIAVLHMAISRLPAMGRLTA